VTVSAETGTTGTDGTAGNGAAVNTTTGTSTTETTSNGTTEDDSDSSTEISGGMLSFTFDDGFFNSNMQQAFEKMRLDSIPGTLYVVTDWVGDGDGHFEWPDLLYYSNLNWEIGNHTKSHKHPLEISIADFTNEVDLAEIALQQHGIQATSFAIPYGDGYALNGNGQVALNGGFLNAILGLGDIKSSRQAYKGDNDSVLNYPDTFNPMAIKVLSWKGNTLLSYIFDSIDQALAEGCWLVLVIHVITANPDPNDPDQISLADFIIGCDYIKAAGIETTTISEGVDRMMNY
jgi:peptidoglycan/xylan/chitin deacetylase (PgdA/CDA1 family)